MQMGIVDETKAEIVKFYKQRQPCKPKMQIFKEKSKTDNNIDITRTENKKEKTCTFENKMDKQKDKNEIKKKEIQKIEGYNKRRRVKTRRSFPLQIGILFLPVS